MKTMIAVVLLVGASSAHAERFVASSVPGARIRTEGRVVISNDSKTITAYQFFGDIKTALVSLASIRSFRYQSYGNVIYDSSAPVSRALPSELIPIITEAAKLHGVDPRLVAAVAKRESGFNQRAVSQKGARGLMQLMPATATFLGVRDVHDARDNIFGGTRYLRMLLDTFHGDLDLTLAAYNAGPGAVERYKGVPPYRETQAYVAAVRETYERSLAQ